MRTKKMQVLMSIVLAIGMFVQAAFQVDRVTPVQAASGLSLQWLQNGDPHVGSAAGTQYGKALAMSTNGNQYVIGANAETVNGHAVQGAAYVFWGRNYTLRLLASDGVAGDHFGFSVAISGDGHTILFNANQKDNARGGAYFFSNEPVSSIYFPIIKR